MEDGRSAAKKKNVVRDASQKRQRDEERGTELFPRNLRRRCIRWEMSGTRREIEGTIYDTRRERGEKKNCARKSVGGGAMYLWDEEG